MSGCLTDCTVKEPFTIIRGDDIGLTVRLKVKNLCGDDCDPYDLTGATEIVAKFAKEDGTCLEVKLTDTNITIIYATGGKILIKIASADSALLKVSPNQDFSVTVTDAGGEKHTANFIGCLTVVDPACV